MAHMLSAASRARHHQERARSPTVHSASAGYLPHGVQNMTCNILGIVGPLTCPEAELRSAKLPTTLALTFNPAERQLFTITDLTSTTLEAVLGRQVTAGAAGTAGRLGGRFEVTSLAAGTSGHYNNAIEYSYRADSRTHYQYAGPIRDLPRVHVVVHHFNDLADTHESGPYNQNVALFPLTVQQSTQELLQLARQHNAVQLLVRVAERRGQQLQLQEHESTLLLSTSFRSDEYLLRLFECWQQPCAHVALLFGVKCHTAHLTVEIRSEGGLVGFTPESPALMTLLEVAYRDGTGLVNVGEEALQNERSVTGTFFPTMQNNRCPVCWSDTDNVTHTCTNAECMAMGQPGVRCVEGDLITPHLQNTSDGMEAFVHDVGHVASLLYNNDFNTTPVNDLGSRHGMFEMVGNEIVGYQPF
ncbi:hypothetical protein GPECTOR_170g187 [Gonium pectorale]|uniref:Uncharacterized protein n=1 Tax=Gonium pectorale TaxID=33097 RepID=A0A150FXC9_GONPE|nr:hypothetical protein GPECTOR_170g187 [Gonium pectorale]|eukprot:KXZ42272.1 hypothetical protein GPECTOR_170g187 [Gonium pectorale]